MVIISAGDTRVRITRHALIEMAAETELGFDVTQELAVEVLLRPHQVVPGYGGREIAQSPVDETHLLRVVYETENKGTSNETIVMVTVYIAGREDYEI